MDVTIYKDRKPTEQKVNFPRIDDTSLEKLVASVGEDVALKAAQAGINSACKAFIINRTGTGMDLKAVQIEANAYVPTFKRGGHSKKSEADKILDRFNKVESQNEKARIRAELEQLVAKLKSSAGLKAA